MGSVFLVVYAVAIPALCSYALYRAARLWMWAAPILATLAENPAAAGVDIVTRATLVTPHAPRVLTGGLQREGAEPEAVGAYLAEELALGDAEEAIGALTAQLAGGVAPEEAELLHAAVTTLQMDVAARRLAHRTLPSAP